MDLERHGLPEVPVHASVAAAPVGLRRAPVATIVVLVGTSAIIWLAASRRTEQPRSAPSRFLYSGLETTPLGPQLVPKGGFQGVPANGGSHPAYATAGTWGSLRGAGTGQQQQQQVHSVGSSWTPSSANTAASIIGSTPAPSAAPTVAPTLASTAIHTTAPTHAGMPASLQAVLSQITNWFPPTLALAGSSGHHVSTTLQQHDSNAEAGDFMIMGSLAMVACLFCCGCLMKKCGSRLRRKEEDECNTKDWSHVPDRGTHKVPGQYSYAANPKPGKTTPSGGPRADQNFRAASQETKGLLTPEDDEKSGGDSSLRAEAAREVERILAAPNQLTVLGGGAKKERTAKFRQLARMLHPDKGLVDGDRAALALRRVVEAHHALSSQEP